jgi:putative transposase
VFIKAESANYRVTKLCVVLGVTRSGYYAWDKRPESQKTKRRRRLAKLVETEFEENHRILGSKKITQNLLSKGEKVSRGLVAKIMREKGLVSKVVKKYKATTNSKHNLPVAENLLNREFHAFRLNEKWVSDITYVSTDEGWLYLAGILDLCGHEVVGWSMGERMTKELVIRCLNQALGRRGNPRGVLLHSDRGSQYCSHEYQALLRKSGFICSMSRKGNCYDNAPMESFWGKLKQEWLNDKHFKTRAEAMAAIFWYIEVFYRRKRPHESNGYLTPEAYSKSAANF